MKERKVEFFSDGAKIAGLLRSPDTSSGPLAGIVQGPGWLGLKDAKLYLPYHEALTAAGFHVLIFDYRGFGDSEGDRGLILPEFQLQDLINAVTFMTTLEEVDEMNIGVFGSGGTGGGNSILLGAVDRRIKCVVSQVPVSDGEDWLHRMRQEHEWVEFLRRLDEDRKLRVTTGVGALVNPLEEIMVATPERQKTNVKGDVANKIPNQVPLSCAEAILRYKPIEFVRIVAPTPLLIIGVENDAVTPTDHAIDLYEAAGEPKKLIMQRATTHYEAYKQYGEYVIPEIVLWFAAALQHGEIDIHEATSTGRSFRTLRIGRKN